MTIKEAILSYPGLADIAGDFISMVLLNRSIGNDGSLEYTITSKTTVNLCAADCYAYVINDPDFSESKYSVKMSRASMAASAERLYRENGEPDKASALSPGRGNAKNDFW